MISDEVLTEGTQAVGIQPASGEKGGVTLITKKGSAVQKPNQAISTTFNGGKSTRKTYKAVANAVAKSGYRGDLRAAAVARASAIRRSQRPVKASPVNAPRGVKAKAAAAAAAENSAFRRIEI